VLKIFTGLKGTGTVFQTPVFDPELIRRTVLPDVLVARMYTFASSVVISRTVEMFC
jgi:hypothetical protein